MPNNEMLIASMPAWILSVDEHFKIALDESSLSEYIRDPQLHSVPDAVAYCNQLVLWRNNFTPVIDLSLVLGGVALDSQHVAVIGYQEYAHQKPQYVAIKLINEVQRVTVMDDTACEWPEDYPLEIQPIVESLFVNQEQLVSVINVADLCNEGYRDYLVQLAENKTSA